MPKNNCVSSKVLVQFKNMLPPSDLHLLSAGPLLFLAALWERMVIAPAQKTFRSVLGFDDKTERLFWWLLVNSVSQDYSEGRLDMLVAQWSKTETCPERAYNELMNEMIVSEIRRGASVINPDVAKINTLFLDLFSNHDQFVKNMIAVRRPGSPRFFATACRDQERFWVQPPDRVLGPAT